MQCQRCGYPFSESVPGFCPNCGAPARSTAATGPATPTYPAPQSAPQSAAGPDPVGQEAACTVGHAAAEVAAGIGPTLEAPRLLQRIPGRSFTIVGLGLVLVAILLSPLPWFSGIGFFWSLIMLAGGALVALQELRLGGIQFKALSDLPPALDHPLLPPVYAALTAVHAYHLLSFRVDPLIWVAAAVLLCYDQYKKAILAPGSFGQYFDLRLAWHGYRRYILLGAAVCLASLFFTWAKVTSTWAGLFSVWSSWYYRSSGYGWGLPKYYWPGFQLTGRSQAFSLYIEMFLFALVVWSAYRGSGTVPAWFNKLAVGLAGLVSLWWLFHIAAHPGPWIFLVGLGLIDLAVVMIYLGKQTGPYDMEHLLGRGKREGSSQP